ncbi:DNA translocase FtsK [Croceimicrobium hydrocarbonivorans]|uniref:DNA translocase FtsK n=1 Tax=Croceimicrobium hydrocarbonivorans TaxID=2761580 RepID=A0A7H0VF99_9FLAO|nr:DNA translocase FtsK [Croceimicrobium hydrocarbonivorans]QNR24397.1 DNA translocase FtsK [Croceimicrobium hydrocarbonivorans]
MATKKQSKSRTKAKSNRPKLSTAQIGEAFRNPTYQMVFGIFLVSTALFLGGSFFSYLLHWTQDQSLVGQTYGEVLARPEIQAQNALGKLGAGMAHQFIHLWFGIAAFLVPWFLLISGLRLSLRVSLQPLRRSFASSLFLLIWIPSLFAFVAPQSSYLSGASGHFYAAWLGSLAGPIGTLIVLLASMLIYLAIRFRWTADKVKGFFGKFKRPEKKELQDPEPHLEVKDDYSESLASKKQEEEPDHQEDIESLEEETKEEPSLEFELETQAEEEAQASEDDKPSAPEPEAPSEEEDGTYFEIEQKEEEEALSASEVNRKVKEFGPYDPTLDLSKFKLPTLDLLKDYGSTNITINEEELASNKNKIVETLNNYKIEISKIKATIGPTVTLYEIVPAPGVRISRIKNLEDDIALSLSALGIRIIAPIPGRGTIGIEVPSTNPQMVPMRNLVAGEKFQESKMELPIVFGKTISNETYVTDLAKMPHLLMAGATGQGKSVGLNVILTSLLYRKHPSQVKFVLVDPKKVELTLFNKIERHYLAKLPDTEEAIITDTTKVINTLNSLCIEMDDRYELLKNAMVRNIKEYNAKFIARKLNPEEGHRYLPYIVLVIDEFADLIMTAGKEVETPIARLAQLARAIGIHLIVATQRPSVNVITGIIKANFPARVAFRVTSKIDSRTILDAGGAEQLIGKGDMLLSQGSDLIRLQCAFVDTPEVEKITDYIGGQKAYPEAYKLPEYKGADEDGNTGIDILDPSERDALFEDAARLVVQSQQGSTSMLQRKLKLGYNRAGRIVDQLEAAGIIGPFEGSKAREVLIPDEYALEQLLNHEKNKE